MKKTGTKITWGKQVSFQRLKLSELLLWLEVYQMFYHILRKEEERKLRTNTG